MNYSETLEFLYAQLPMYQREGKAAYKADLNVTIKLDEHFRHPHQFYPTIHVAGTNGKGSVSHMVASALQQAGFRTGLYTSPHLKDFRERIRIDGEMITEKYVTNFVEDNQRIIKELKPSFFEITAAMAFDYFAREKVDIAIIEVGLGGRLDSTNIISPEVCIITNIGLDHTALLGDSVEKIAIEKAGIIKPGIPVVIGTSQNETELVFKGTAHKKNAPVYFADKEFSVSYALSDLDGNQLLTVEKNGNPFYQNLKLDLKGAYQQKNLPAVLKTVELLQQTGWELGLDNIFKGLESVSKITGLLGRWHILGYNPQIVCDTAHNAEGITEIVRQIEQTPYKQLHIVFGMVNDKEPEKILRLLPANARYYFTKAKIPRALDEKELAAVASKIGLRGETYKSVKAAVKSARLMAGKNDFIFIGGSTFVVSEIL